MGWSEFEMNLNNAKLKTLPLSKSVCDGNNLYFTRTGDTKGKFTFRYQRLGKKHEMGWRVKGDHSAEIKSFFHKCYDGLRFPAFVEPQKRWSFGTKIMAQGRSARDQLEGKPLYAHTVFGAGDDGWIWMNLAQLDSPNTKPVPVRIVGELPPEVRCLTVRKVS